MFYSLLENIKEIGIFMVLCQTIMHLTPAKQYEKYFKPIIGFMVLSKVMISIISLKQSDTDAIMDQLIRKYEIQMDISIDKLNEDITYVNSISQE